MNHQQLHLLIQAGENSCVEFKSAAVRNESLAKEMVAFANSNGGSIVVGVEDCGDVTGVEDAAAFEERIMSIARTSVVPAVIPHVEILPYEERSIVLVTITKGIQKPYQTVDGKFLIRVGSTNRTASHGELMRLFQQSGVFHYDLIGVPQTGIKDLNLAEIDNYFMRYNVAFSEESEQERVRLLKNTDVLTEEGTCTIAGLLLFGIHPQRRLFNCSISVAMFAGIEISEEMADLKNIEGTLPMQVDTASALIQSLLPVANSLVGNKRVDSPEYSATLFRELLVNAVVHRNYALEGSRIRIFLFTDRIEIRSPGRLPNTVTTEKIRAGVSYAVNPVIMKFMENLRYIDKLGRGIPMVCSEVARLNRTVTFEEIGEEFVVTLSRVSGEVAQ